MVIAVMTVCAKPVGITPEPALGCQGGWGVSKTRAGWGVLCFSFSFLSPPFHTSPKEEAPVTVRPQFPELEGSVCRQRGLSLTPHGMMSWDIFAARGLWRWDGSRAALARKGPGQARVALASNIVFYMMRPPGFEGPSCHPLL